MYFFTTSPYGDEPGAIGSATLTAAKLAAERVGATDDRSRSTAPRRAKPAQKKEKIPQWIGASKNFSKPAERAFPLKNLF